MCLRCYTKRILSILAHTKRGEKVLKKLTVVYNQNGIILHQCYLIGSKLSLDRPW